MLATLLVFLLIILILAAFRPLHTRLKEYVRRSRILLAPTLVHLLLLIPSRRVFLL